MLRDGCDAFLALRRFFHAVYERQAHMLEIKALKL